jgi:hypothetical protein
MQNILMPCKNSRQPPGIPSLCSGKVDIPRQPGGYFKSDACPEFNYKEVHRAMVDETFFSRSG